MVLQLPLSPLWAPCSPGPYLRPSHAASFNNTPRCMLWLCHHLQEGEGNTFTHRTIVSSGSQESRCSSGESVPCALNYQPLRSISGSIQNPDLFTSPLPLQGPYIFHKNENQEEGVFRRILHRKTGWSGQPGTADTQGYDKNICIKQPLIIQNWHLHSTCVLSPFCWLLQEA